MASKAPVEAPDGTAARPVLPSSRPTSTSTVGLPRESRISRATTTSMDGTSISFWDVTRGHRTSAVPRAEPNRPEGIGQPVDHSLSRTQGKHCSRTEQKRNEEGAKRSEGAMKNPAPVRTGEHAPERGARGDGG